MKKIILISALFVSSTAHAFLSVNPLSLNVGSVRVGQTAFASNIMVQNFEQADELINVTNSCSFDFSINSTCAYLSQYASCNIWVNFRPSQVMRHSCSINIWGRYGSSTVWVQGEGINQ